METRLTSWCTGSSVRLQGPGPKTEGWPSSSLGTRTTSTVPSMCSEQRRPGRSQEWGNGDKACKLVHGQPGEVAGPGAKDGSVSMKFPGNPGNVDCGLHELGAAPPGPLPAGDQFGGGQSDQATPPPVSPRDALAMVSFNAGIAGKEESEEMERTRTPGKGRGCCAVVAQTERRLHPHLWEAMPLVTDGAVTRELPYCLTLEGVDIIDEKHDLFEKRYHYHFVDVTTFNSWAEDLAMLVLNSAMFFITAYSHDTFIAATMWLGTLQHH